MRAWLRSLLNRPLFWWGLVIANGLTIDTQPLGLCYTAVALVALHGLLLVTDAVMNDTARPAARVVRRVIGWGLLYLLFLVPTGFIVGCLDVEWKLFPSAKVAGLLILLVPALGCGLCGILRWRWRIRSARKSSRTWDSRDPLVLHRTAHVPGVDPVIAQAEQRRREDARAKVELFFNVHAPELKARFTRDMLDDYVRRYMGDDKAAEVVEARADTLLEVIRQHLEKVQPASARDTFDDLLARFALRKRKIQESDLDTQDKEMLLIQIEEEREAAVRKAVRDGRV